MILPASNLPDPLARRQAERQGVDKATYAARRRRGKSPAEAARQPKQPRRGGPAINPDSIRQRCQQAGIHTSNFYKARRKHPQLSDDEIIACLAVNRRTRPSIAEQCRKVGIAVSTYYARRRAGEDREKALSRGPMPRWQRGRLTKHKRKL